MRRLIIWVNAPRISRCGQSLFHLSLAVWLNVQDALTDTWNLLRLVIAFASQVCAENACRTKAKSSSSACQFLLLPVGANEAQVIFLLSSEGAAENT
jgi:hypothetical protein